MQLEQLQAQRNAATSLKQSSSMPPCCGTGCAVCVLDYWEPDEFDIPAQEISGASSDNGQENHPRNITNADCCSTGCAVCVLDYPEYFSKQRSESETLAMLEAIEQAQQQAQRLIANQDGDTQ